MFFNKSLITFTLKGTSSTTIIIGLFTKFIDFYFYTGIIIYYDFGKFGSNILGFAVTLFILGSYATLILNDELQL